MQVDQTIERLGPGGELASAATHANDPVGGPRLAVAGWGPSHHPCQGSRVVRSSRQNSATSWRCLLTPRGSELDQWVRLETRGRFWPSLATISMTPLARFHPRSTSQPRSLATGTTTSSDRTPTLARVIRRRTSSRTYWWNWREAPTPWSSARVLPRCIACLTACLTAAMSWHRVSCTTAGRTGCAG